MEDERTSPATDDKTHSDHDNQDSADTTQTKTQRKRSVKFEDSVDVISVSKAVADSGDCEIAHGAESKEIEASRVAYSPEEDHESRKSEMKAAPKMSRMREELLKLDAEDARQNKLEKEKKKRLVEEEFEREVARRVAKGIEIMPDSRRSKGMVKGVMRHEEIMATRKIQKKLDKETNSLKKDIDNKYRVDAKTVRSTDMMELTKDYFNPNKMANDYLPEKVIRDLTSEEIEDLKVVFEMFDANGKGYITSNDVQRAAGMLGFRAKKSVFEGMIGELTAGDNGRITFKNFLDFVLQSQGQGPDPYEEMLQGFRMMDKHENGYITREDIIEAANGADYRISNKILEEMMEEADQTGDGKITRREFIDIMQQTSLFKVVT